MAHSQILKISLPLGTHSSRGFRQLFLIHGESCYLLNAPVTEFPNPPDRHCEVFDFTVPSQYLHSRMHPMKLETYLKHGEGKTLEFIKDKGSASTQELAEVI